MFNGNRINIYILDKIVRHFCAETLDSLAKIYNRRYSRGGILFVIPNDMSPRDHPYIRKWHNSLFTTQ